MKQNQIKFLISGLVSFLLTLILSMTLNAQSQSFSHLDQAIAEQEVLEHLMSIDQMILENLRAKLLAVAEDHEGAMAEDGTYITEDGTYSIELSEEEANIITLFQDVADVFQYENAVSTLPFFINSLRGASISKEDTTRSHTNTDQIAGAHTATGVAAGKLADDANEPRPGKSATPPAPDTPPAVASKPATVQAPRIDSGITVQAPRIDSGISPDPATPSKPATPPATPPAPDTPPATASKPATPPAPDTPPATASKPATPPALDTPPAIAAQVPQAEIRGLKGLKPVTPPAPATPPAIAAQVPQAEIRGLKGLKPVTPPAPATPPATPPAPDTSNFTRKVDPVDPVANVFVRSETPKSPLDEPTMQLKSAVDNIPTSPSNQKGMLKRAFLALSRGLKSLWYTVTPKPVRTTFMITVSVIMGVSSYKYLEENPDIDGAAPARFVVNVSKGAVEILLNATNSVLSFLQSTVQSQLEIQENTTTVEQPFQQLSEPERGLPLEFVEPVAPVDPEPVASVGPEPVDTTETISSPFAETIVTTEPEIETEPVDVAPVVDDSVTTTTNNEEDSVANATVATESNEDGESPPITRPILPIPVVPEPQR